MEKHQLLQHQTQIVSETLEQILGTNQAYVFGYKDERHYFSVFPTADLRKTNKPHLDILVFSAKTFEGLNNTLSDLIAQRSRQEFSATILLHQTKHLKERSTDMHWFFDRVLHFGIPLGDYELKTGDPICDPERDLVAAEAFWHKCEAVASLYLESALESQRLDIELAKVALLTQAVEYLLLGLVRIFLGYTPIQHNLKFLFSLCGHFTALHEVVFEQETAIGKRNFRQLCVPATMLRQWDKLELPEAEFESLSDACQTFCDEATKLALTKLAQLKNNPKIETR
ncbi:hypothetical protein [Flavobacterium sp.]|uniref:hypothetical protein n=1 Tax=Flavobacterium sp. TaxID=239 RepID=UPI0012117D7B|nr:hypothetical protein [Flavobacterium sp.]RZJ69866.1 MAG: hypothetical protein EOO49_15655 [Flavobacterium sp.]